MPKTLHPAACSQQTGLTRLCPGAVRSGKSLGSLWQVHDVMRMALCDLWTDNHACCAANLQCALRKLSRESGLLAAALAQSVPVRQVQNKDFAIRLTARTQVCTYAEAAASADLLL